jgi:hypothetical protein
MGRGRALLRVIAQLLTSHYSRNDGLGDRPGRVIDGARRPSEKLGLPLFSTHSRETDGAIVCSVQELKLAHAGHCHLALFWERLVNNVAQAIIANQLWLNELTNTG